MTAILSITLNPAVDLSTSVDRVEPGPKLRCAAPIIDPGGGGINIARAIKVLGGNCHALVAVGGKTGDHVLSMLADQNVDTAVLRLAGDTRQSLSVTEETTGDQYRFVLPGPVFSASELQAALDLIAASTPADSLVVFSGSMPPGVPEDIVTQVASALAPQRARLLVDTSGPALQRVIDSPDLPPWLLRVDQNEAQIAAGRPLNALADSADFARQMVARGVADMVIIGHGAEGTVLASRDACILCAAPVVKVQSKTGAGDSFMGALTLRLALGDDPGTALQWGVAAASAAVMTPGTALCQRADVEALLAECVLSNC